MARRSSPILRRRLSLDRLEPRVLLAAPEFYPARATGIVDAADIRSSSGIIASRSSPGVLWTFNDVGDSRVFAINARGDLLGTYQTGATVLDYEDIAVGPGPQAGVSYLYVADIGDNSQTRSQVKLIRVAEPAVDPRQSPTTATLSDVQSISLDYPDGSHNAETLLVDPQTAEIYVVTKSGARGRIYSAGPLSSSAGMVVLQFRGELTWTEAAAGDISPDGGEILMKDLDTVYYYARPAGTSIASVLQGTPATLPYKVEPLGEGITFDADGKGYFTNSEGANQPLHYYERKAPGNPLRFAVIGGYGFDGANEMAVADLVQKWDPTLVVTTGGNNYDQGSAATIDANIGKHYQRFISGYAGSFGPGASTNRFFPAMDDQDWSTAGGTGYLNYFSLPGNERYYDFVRGPVHFFAISSGASEPSGQSSTSVQAQWLQSALAASTSEYQVVYLHDAPYSSGTGGSNSAMQWPFQQWGADAVIAGSDHLYERLEINGTPYFVVGNGGRSLGTVQSVLAGSQFRDAARYGAVLVTAGDGGLTFEYWSSDGVLRDQYSLTDGDAAVVGRRVFYNQSTFDGNDATANASDDAAIATDKVALLPGGTASFANYTSFNRGLNGIMVDISGLPPGAALSASDFEFKVGNSDTPSDWAAVAAAPTVSVRPAPGAPGTSRVTLVWPSGGAIKQWLQVTVKANDNTGLNTPDVFYFGNAVGESGNVAGDYSVSITDELLARNNPVGISTGATVINRFDYNRDGTVSVVDQLLARNNITTAATRLRQIIVSAPVQAGGLMGQSMSDTDIAHGLLAAGREGKTPAEPRRAFDSAIKPVAAESLQPQALDDALAEERSLFGRRGRAARAADVVDDEVLELLAARRRQ